MLRTIPIWALLVCSVVTVADAKPFIVKVFAPVGYSSARSTATVAPANTQFISTLISTKIQLLNSILQAKSNFGGFGIRKQISFLGPATTTTATERPVTQSTTEVNTDFIPEVSSSTQSVYTTTTTEGDFATPEPTVRPLYPIKTSTPLIPTESTTTESTPEPTTSTGSSSNGYTYEPSVSTTQGYTYQPPISITTPHAYSYRPPTPNPYYLPASNQI